MARALANFSREGACLCAGNWRYHSAREEVRKTGNGGCSREDTLRGSIGVCTVEKGGCGRTHRYGWGDIVWV